jgi:predicted MPP superfamily phosphohydrolase
MPRIVHLVIFLTIFTLLAGGAHYYILTRLSHYLSIGVGGRKIMGTLSLLMLAFIVGGMFLIRSLPRELATPIAWIVFPWMGILLLMTVIMGATDLFYLLTKAAMPAAQIVDPARRIALQKLFGVAALGATAVLSGISIRNALRPVTVKPLQVTLKRLPPALDGLRIVQLTDLHLGPTIDGTWLQGVVDKTNELNPDIVAITGDLVDGSVAELGGYAAVLKDLRAKYGVFFVTGNHEYYSGADEWIAFIGTLDIRVLRNERVSLDLPGGGIDIAGVDDFSAREFPGHGADLPKALAGRDTTRPLILMAHQPRAIEEAAAHGVDLQLSGHTHGGQIWPWNFLVLLQQPYIKGLHRHKNTATQIYISDGTGYWGPPMRLGTAAEITDITLHSAA